MWTRIVEKRDSEAIDQFENEDMVRCEVKQQSATNHTEWGNKEENQHYHMTINCVNNPPKDTIVGETGISSEIAIRISRSVHNDTLDTLTIWPWAWISRSKIPRWYATGDMTILEIAGIECRAFPTGISEPCSRRSNLHPLVGVPIPGKAWRYYGPGLIMPSDNACLDILHQVGEELYRSKK